MCCGKCDRGMMLCPISFGLALGITYMIGMLVAGIWMMYRGVPPFIASMLTSPLTWTDVFVFSLLGLLKGFVFGAILALFYDLFVCCKRGCRHKEMMAGKCACGSACNCAGVCKCCSTNPPREGL